MTMFDVRKAMLSRLTKLDLSVCRVGPEHQGLGCSDNFGFHHGREVIDPVYEAARGDEIVARFGESQADLAIALGPSGLVAAELEDWGTNIPIDPALAACWTSAHRSWKDGPVASPSFARPR